MLLRSQGKLDVMAKSAEKLYEHLADAMAKISTNQLNGKSPELLVNDCSYLPNSCTLIV